MPQNRSANISFFKNGRGGGTVLEGNSEQLIVKLYFKQVFLISWCSDVDSRLV